MSKGKSKKDMGMDESGLQLTGIARGEEMKTCLDCLHCKVSAKSKKTCRMCYCSETKKKERHRITHWQKKKVCKKFSDMSVDEIKRQPILKKRA
jgi:hypothetical protein